MLYEHETLPREKGYVEERLRRKGRRRLEGVAPALERALRAGWARFDAGDFAGAEREFSAAAAAFPRSALARGWRGEARLQASYFGPRARPLWWRRARERYPKPGFWVWDSYPMEPGGLDLLEDFERAAALDPDCPWYVLKRGEVRYNLVFHHAYLEDLRLACRLDPLSAWNHAWLGDLYSQMKRPEAGLRECREALRLDPGAAWILAIEGKVLAFTPGRLGDAAASFNRALSLEPGSGWLWSWRGEVRRLQGRYGDTIADCTRCLELDPGYYFAYVWRGGARRRLGDAAGARADLDEALRLAPGYPWSWSWRALLRRDSGDLEGAVADMARACALRPAFTWVFAESGRPRSEAKAAASLARILEADPACAPALAWRGELAFKQGRFREALADLDAALAQGDEAAPWARLWRGKALLMLDKPHAALEDLRWAEARWARYADPALWLAQALYRLGQEGEALRWVERCLEIDPRASRGLVLRALLRGRRGDAAGQAEDYRAAKLFHPALFERETAEAWA